MPFPQGWHWTSIAGSGFWGALGSITSKSAALQADLDPALGWNCLLGAVWRAELFKPKGLRLCFPRGGVVFNFFVSGTPAISKSSGFVVFLAMATDIAIVLLLAGGGGRQLLLFSGGKYFLEKSGDNDNKQICADNFQTQTTWLRSESQLTGRNISSQTFKIVCLIRYDTFRKQNIYKVSTYPGSWQSESKTSTRLKQAIPKQTVSKHLQDFNKKFQHVMALYNIL